MLWDLMVAKVAGEIPSWKSAALAIELKVTLLASGSMPKCNWRFNQAESNGSDIVRPLRVTIS